MKKKSRRGGFLPNFITQQCSKKICLPKDLNGKDSINEIFNGTYFLPLISNNKNESEEVKKKMFVTFLLRLCKEKGLYSLNGQCKEDQTIYNVSELYDKIKRGELDDFIVDSALKTDDDFNTFFERKPKTAGRRRTRRTRRRNKTS